MVNGIENNPLIRRYSAPPVGASARHRTAGLSEKQIFIAARSNDPISPVREAEELQEDFEAANALVAIYWGNYGHQLTGSEVQAARQ